ncbi:acyl carrier protein [Nocardia sp. BMG51109]|uniref:acyl carrier protein n=1 Tax=Nocardia sp. BMG51109 TaxID=1056816 RepID=UPI000467663E|nr:phosphopantetheine-binding protein [Nocardia sp. BMG51109]
MTAVEDEVAHRVRRLIEAMAPDPRPPADDLRLVEDLGFDSLRLMELTVVLERTFALPRYRPEQVAGVHRVGDVVDLIEGTLSGSRASVSEVEP